MNRNLVRGITACATALALAACTGIHTPHDIAGDVPLTLVNSQTDQGVCVAFLVPAGSQFDASHNVLGHQKLAPGGVARLAVQPGTYRFAAADCDLHRGSDAVTGTLAQNDAVTVKGPTLLSVGGPPSQPPSGVDVVVVASGARSREVCIGSGGDCTFEANGHCCAGLACTQVAPGHGECR